MNTYEIVLLLSPSLSESQVQGHIEEFKNERLKLYNAEVSFEDFWGRKTLAYTIEKETSAYYVVLHISCTGENIAPLDEDIRLDKSIIRHLITRLETSEKQVTQEERKGWNQENLPERKSKNKPEEKRAPLRSRRSPQSSSTPAPERMTPPSSSPVKKEEKLDKKQLEKKLDEILDGDLDL